MDPSTICPVFAETGECRHGLKCRFLGGHVQKDDRGNLVLMQDEEKQARSAVSAKEINFMSPDVLKLLRSKKVRSKQFLKHHLNEFQYPHLLADAYLNELQVGNTDGSNDRDTLNHSVEAGAATIIESVQPMDTTPDTNTMKQISRRTGGSTSPQNDAPDVPVRYAEKKRLNWAGKTCECRLFIFSFSAHGIFCKKIWLH